MCYFAAVQHRLDASRLQPRHLMGPQKGVRDPKGGHWRHWKIHRLPQDHRTDYSDTEYIHLGDAVLLIRAALVPPHVPAHAFAVGGARSGLAGSQSILGGH